MELSPNVIFSLPSGFFFGVVAPLDLEKFDSPGPGGSESFFQDTDGHFTIRQILVDLNGSVIDVLENFGLRRHF